MCYRCEACNGVVKAGAKTRRYVTYRPIIHKQVRDKKVSLTIDHEYKVCEKCENLLSSGCTIQQLREVIHKKPKPVKNGEKIAPRKADLATLPKGW